MRDDMTISPGSARNDRDPPRRALPLGTQVVTLAPINTAGGRVVPAGAVAVVVAQPDSNGRPYRVQFPDGTEGVVAPDEIDIRAHLQRAGLGADAAHVVRDDLFAHVIYRCVVGSRAYGLDEEGSDTDRRGIYVPPAKRHWSLHGVPEQLEDEAAQETYWEVQKFLVLALKANPNVLECLYSSLVEMVTPMARELLDMRHIFLSRLVYQTYNGYVLSQFKKLEQDLRARTHSLEARHAPDPAAARWRNDVAGGRRPGAGRGTPHAAAGDPARRTAVGGD